MNQIYSCTLCNKSFKYYKSVPRKYCSTLCAESVHKGVGHPRYKGRIRRGGYWYLRIPDHPMAGKQGYIAEHRVIMEKNLGRYIAKIECVHHINHDPSDNRIENLQLFSTHGEHTKIAHPEASEKARKANTGRKLQPGQGFQKGTVPWNKNKKGVMPTPWNKGLSYQTRDMEKPKWKIKKNCLFCKIEIHPNPKQTLKEAMNMKFCSKQCLWKWKVGKPRKG